MKTIKKNVYYCDFCKKKNLSASAMSKHEKHCTANPDRECRMCECSTIKTVIANFKSRFKLNKNRVFNNITGVEAQFPYPEFIVEWTGKEVTLDEVREEADNCPACTLAIIRQCGFFNDYFNSEFKDKFDFKKEMETAMAEKNKEQYESEHYNYPEI